MHRGMVVLEFSPLSWEMEATLCIRTSRAQLDTGEAQEQPVLDEPLSQHQNKTPRKPVAIPL